MFNIPLRVKNIIRRHDTCNPYIIAKELKIGIIYGETPDRVNGFWRRVLRRKYICINEDLEEWQQKTVLCHELGHIFLHPGYKNYCMAGRTYFSCTRREDEADQFAAEIMGYSSDIEKINILDFLKNGYKVNQTY